MYSPCGSFGDCCGSCNGFLSAAYRIIGGGCLSPSSLLPLPSTAAPPAPGAWADPFGVLSRGAGRSLAVHIHGLDGFVQDAYCRQPLVRAHIVDETTGRWVVLPPQALAQALASVRPSQQATAPELRQSHGTLLGSVGARASSVVGGIGAAVFDAATPRATMPCSTASAADADALHGSAGGTTMPRAVSFGGASAPRMNGTDRAGAAHRSDDHDHSLGWSGAGALAGHPRWE